MIIFETTRDRLSLIYEISSASFRWLASRVGGDVTEGKREQNKHGARYSTLVVLLSVQMRRVVDDFRAGDETRGQFRPAKLLLPAFPWFMEASVGSSDRIRESSGRRGLPGKWNAARKKGSCLRNAVSLSARNEWREIAKTILIWN